ncbi:MAG: N-acetylmuramoyl-L-alanine amidase [Chloroflexi bacterium]|nr:MAG: N-acetylmuramoyl-L-alanine amidase [Chloroflexota bacterium]
MRSDRVVSVRIAVTLVCSVLVACQGAIPIPAQGSPLNPDETFIPAGAPLPVLQSSLTSDPTDDDSFKPAIAPPGGVILRHSTNTILLRAPSPPLGARRVGIQVGHWKIDEVPAEQDKLRAQTGAIWEDVHEVDVNLDVAQKVAALLRRQGVTVDLLPATIPPGYVADAFLALHADSDGVGELSGFKLAHGPLRGPFEDRLLADVKDAYGKASGLSYDGAHISVDMTYYYPFNWGRFQHATSAHTPAAILEMGYLSSDDDRPILTDEQDKLASGIADGLLRFLADTPRAQIFKDDIVVKLPAPAPSASP